MATWGVLGYATPCKANSAFGDQQRLCSRRCVEQDEKKTRRNTDTCTWRCKKNAGLGSLPKDVNLLDYCGGEGRPAGRSATCELADLHPPDRMTSEGITAATLPAYQHAFASTYGSCCELLPQAAVTLTYPPILRFTLRPTDGKLGSASAGSFPRTACQRRYMPRSRRRSPCVCGLERASTN